MVYLDADNNLDGAGIDDFNEMAKVGSTANMNVVVEMDRAEGEDNSNNGWTDTKLFYVTKGLTPTPENALMDLGEKNMGDPDTLIDFVLWAVKNYPAKHYLLDLWDHGGGWQGVCWDDTDGGDFLTLPEIEYALQAIRAKLNRNIDIVLFDACAMGNLEVFYQLRNYVDIAVGSEASVPGDGCPYDKILSPLVENPAMTPEELARVIVDAYIHSYSDGEADPEDVPWVTFSAFTLKRFDELAEIADEFCMLLSKNAALFPEGYNLRIVRCRKNAQTFIPYVPSVFPNVITSMVDLCDFASEISREVGIGSNEKVKAKQLMSIFEEMRIAEAHGNTFPQAQGLTIYFPNDKLATEYRESYDKVAFAAHKYWDEFIHHVNNMENAKDTPPTSLIVRPERWEIITSESYLIEGSAFDVESLQEVQLKIDNGEWVTAYGTETWSYEWKTSPGKHTIYTRSFDGTGYSTVSSVNVDVVSKENEAGGYSLFILPLIAAMAVLVIIAVIKRKRNLRLSK